VDVAPTIAFLMDIPGPQNARGRILYQIVEGTSQLREVDILDISDYHGQLVPLSEPSDSLGPSFDIGGSAFLKPWFAAYRAEAPSGSLVVAGGDSVGASPPISSFFGEKTTIEFMNRMGVDLDALGNHNFDRGEQYLRNELIPLAKFKYVSANIVDPATGEPPAEWSKSRVFDFGSFKVGIVGFSNTDIPELTKPGSLGPFVVTDPLAAVNKRAAQLRKQSGLAAVVALGHLGATGPIGSGTTAPNGALLAPTGPLLDLADGTTNVDAVIGDHTNFQVVSKRSNDVLVTENLSKGVRFTRLRLVIDPVAKQVVYTTADFHKPWNIGVTADPQIQARVNELNDILAPQLGVVVGQSTVAIPRSDACGQSAGRTCESKVGDVISDAMRTSQGAQFAITNSGGIRDQLTCPPAGGGSGFCPASTPPPFPITRGQILTVLPFGNFAVTVKVNGAELKTMLENGVSQIVNPTTLEVAAAGRFPQVSGLCFTYNIAASAGNRVVGATPQNPDGTCAASPNLLAEPSRVLSVAINDFMATGGDGYPSSYPGGATSNGDVIADVVEDYVAAAPSSTISPSIQGRIACTDTNGSSLPNCPVVSP
jgi:2',3'-cyclic-nucleotide 2'-phosphodiesterase (5'-nucleotidase family)